VSYQDKIETKLNDLQKDFFRLFRKSFPDLTDKIKIEKGIIHPDCFCFSVTSASQVFGKLSFDIDDTEVTVFSDYDHRHFATYYFDAEKNRQRQNLLTCEQAIEYIKDFVNGNIIIEYKEQDGKIVQTLQYHKDEPSSAFSATINLKDEKREPNGNLLLTQLKNLFRRNQGNNTTTVTKKINWFGEIN
jgi:hypothetical protein